MIPVRLADGDLVFPWGEGEQDGAGLRLPQSSCVSVTRQAVAGGGVRLAFHFRRGEDEDEGGGKGEGKGEHGDAGDAGAAGEAEVTARVTVPAERLADVEDLLARLTSAHPGIALLDGDDWLSSPVSAETRELFDVVTARLAAGGHGATGG
ncbi:hypothetical protein ACTWP5_05420 [Streptomyces sp. 4N509B]|uniref:hypothetical protein n=1 Tax=Streptomyces sp. 4N509B TaxID=3457413 RepID=UPI003FD3B353